MNQASDLMINIFLNVLNIIILRRFLNNGEQEFMHEYS
jgi:hypothetical protein